MRPLLFIIILSVCTALSAAINVCDTTVANYVTYSYGYTCNGEDTYIGINNITSTNKVLVLSPNGSYLYTDVSALNVGDTVRTVAGDTQIVSITPSIIAAPEILNSENYIPARATSAYKQFSSWIGLDASSMLPYLKPASTSSSNIVIDENIVTTTLVRNLNEFVVNEKNVTAATDNYKPQLGVNYGIIYCQDNFYELIYYDTQQLLSNCFGSTFQEIRLTGRLTEFQQMVQSITASGTNLAFVNEATLFDFTVDIPSCNSRIITTANGYITINGVTFRSSA